MNTIQALGLISGVLTLIATAVSLAKSYYEICKLKKEIEELRKSKSEEPIYRPTLNEILRFQGDVGKYAKWLEEKKTKLPARASPLPDLNVLAHVFFFDLANEISLELPANCKLPQSVLKKLEAPKKNLQESSILMNILLIVLLIFGSLYASRFVPLIDWILTPREGTFIFSYSRELNAILLSPCLSTLFIMWYTRYFLTTYIFKEDKKGAVKILTEPQQQAKAVVLIQIRTWNRELVSESLEKHKFSKESDEIQISDSATLKYLGVLPEAASTPPVVVFNLFLSGILTDRAIDLAASLIYDLLKGVKDNAQLVILKTVVKIEEEEIRRVIKQEKVEWVV